MAHSTPKFSFQSTKPEYAQTKGKTVLLSPSIDSVQVILNYSKALEAKEGKSGNTTSYLLN